MITQGNNRRVNCYITYKGETKTLAEWSRLYKINYKLLQMRLYKYKWDFEKAVSYCTGKHYFLMVNIELSRTFQVLLAFLMGVGSQE